jgi:hypothetical protein
MLLMTVRRRGTRGICTPATSTSSNFESSAAFETVRRLALLRSAVPRSGWAWVSDSRPVRGPKPTLLPRGHLLVSLVTRQPSQEQEDDDHGESDQSIQPVARPRSRAGRRLAGSGRRVGVRGLLDGVAAHLATPCAGAFSPVRPSLASHCPSLAAIHGSRPQSVDRSLSALACEASSK